MDFAQLLDFMKLTGPGQEILERLCTNDLAGSKKMIQRSNFLMLIQFLSSFALVANQGSISGKLRSTIVPGT